MTATVLSTPNEPNRPKPACGPNPACQPSASDHATTQTVPSSAAVCSSRAGGSGAGVLVDGRERVGALIGMAGEGLDDGPRQAAELNALAARLRVLAAQTAAVEAEPAVVAVEVEARDGLLAGCSASWWVGFHGGLTEGEPRRLMRGARALARLAVLGEALAAGTISLGTFKPLVRVDTEKNERALLATTGACTPGRWRTGSHDAQAHQRRSGQCRGSATVEHSGGPPGRSPMVGAYRRVGR